MKYQPGIFRALKRSLQLERGAPMIGVKRDPAARFAYDLATKPPTKDVASVKAASDIFEANLRDKGTRDAPSEMAGPGSMRRHSRSES